MSKKINELQEKIELSGSEEIYINDDGSDMKVKIQSIIDNIENENRSVQMCSELPSNGKTGIIYLIRNNSNNDFNKYDKYLWIEDEGRYELIGKYSCEDIGAFSVDGGNIVDQRNYPTQITQVYPNYISLTKYGSDGEHSETNIGSEGISTTSYDSDGTILYQNYLNRKIDDAPKDSKSYVRKDGNWQPITTTTVDPDYTNIPNASDSTNGLMSKEDKIKLDGIGNNMLNALTTKNTIVSYNEDSVGVELQADFKSNFAGSSDNDSEGYGMFEINQATTTSSGVMSASDKYKLDNVENIIDSTTISKIENIISELPEEDSIKGQVLINKDGVDRFNNTHKDTVTEGFFVTDQNGNIGLQYTPSTGFNAAVVNDDFITKTKAIISDSIRSIIKLTQSQYDSLSIKKEDTLYIITD